MDTVRVNKTDLLAKIKANMEKHVKEYNELLADYRDFLLKEAKKVKKEFNAYLKAIANGDAVDNRSFHVETVKPVSHRSDYERVIAMLEMSTEDTITIRQDEFSWYVLDKWSWKGQHEGHRMFYASQKMGLAK